MTAGFFDYSKDPDFTAEVEADPLRVWSPSELVARANAKGPKFAPGSAWDYSNTHTVLLQMVIEQVTGNSLAQEYQNALATPLSLSQTSYPATADLPDPYAEFAVVSLQSAAFRHGDGCRIAVGEGMWALSVYGSERKGEAPPSTAQQHQ